MPLRPVPSLATSVPVRRRREPARRAASATARSPWPCARTSAPRGGRGGVSARGAAAGMSGTLTPLDEPRRRDDGRNARDDSDQRREYQQQPHAAHFRSSPEVPMPEVMNARDEPARGAGKGGHSHGRRLPGAGDFRALVEKLPLIVYIDAPDPVSPSLYVSPQTVEVLGYTQEEWASSPDFFVDILHPDDRDRVVAETAHMIATGERLLSEYRLRRPDGSFSWVRDEGVLVRDSDGEPLWMQGYIQDITESQAARGRIAREQCPHTGDARCSTRWRHHGRPRRRDRRVQSRGGDHLRLRARLRAGPADGRSDRAAGGSQDARARLQALPGDERRCGPGQAHRGRGGAGGRL